ncbi:hypothetical protein N8342_09485 [Acidimicrobiales bacterium]|nr:hypothetical protein [Acidimicrobiales bacterium]
MPDQEQSGRSGAPNTTRTQSDYTRKALDSQQVRDAVYSGHD